jgi:hypothetical protein
MRRKVAALSTLLLLLFSPEALAQCAGNDTKCQLRENLNRMEDQNREDMRNMEEDLDRMMNENRRSDRNTAAPTPPPACDQINSLGSFTRGYQSGGLLGAFANVDEEKRRCEAEAAKAKAKAKAKSTEPVTDFATQHEARVSQVTAELAKQASFDKELATKTCAYHRTTMGKPGSDLAWIVACINLGYIN